MGIERGEPGRRSGPSVSQPERQALLDANPDRYSSLDQVPLTYTDPTKQGGWTVNAGEIDFYTLTSGTSNTWIADATMFHIGHELGHAFNATMIGADSALDRTGNADVPYYNETTGVFSGGGIVDAQGNTIAGGGAERFVLTDTELARIQQEHPEDWQAVVQAASEAQGLRSGTARLESDFDYLRMLPYQQNATNDSASNAVLTNPDSEWFADIFVNYANGTLADNAAGDTIDAWMDTHMQDWIRMRLEASGLIDPLPTAVPAGTGNTTPAGTDNTTPTGPDDTIMP